MEDRKCLRVLHPNMQNQSCLLVSSNGSLSLNTQKRGKKRKNSENMGSTKNRRKDKIYTDSDLEKFMKNVSACTQTDPLQGTTEAPPSTTPAATTSTTPAATTSTTPAATTSTTPAATTSTQATLDMLTSDTPPASYWEALAEKRKEALEETLEENQKLHEKNKELESEISTLKEENKLLDDMVEEAKQLAALVQSITGEEE